MHLSLTSPQFASVADGPILLDLSLTNDGGTPVSVPDPEESRPFAYKILDSEGKDTVALASAALRQAAVPRMTPPLKLPTIMQELGVGASLEYRSDLMSLLAVPLAPGRYLVEASYTCPDGAITLSDRVPVVVIPARPTAMAQTLAQTPGTLVAVELHDQQDGSFLLRKRQSDDTFLGRFFDMRTVRPSTPVLRLAVSVEAAYGTPRDWRWIAWLEGETLFAGVARSTDFTRPTSALPLGLADPVLLPFGYVFKDGSGLFGVVGSANGQRRIGLIQIDGHRDSKPKLIPVELAGLPEPIPNFTLVWNEEGVPELLCMWHLQTQRGSEIGAVRITVATSAIHPLPGRLYETNRQVLATAFPPVIRPGKSGHFQVLLAPEAEGASYTHETVNLLDPADRSTRDLPAFTPPSGQTVTRWVLPSVAFPGAPVVVVTEKELQVCVAGEWRPVASGKPIPDSARVWALSSSVYYCTWFDAVRGYQASGPLALTAQ